jgi:Uncharacterized protein conserved in bacteria
MKTDELIRLLSSGVTPVKQGTVLRRFVAALAITAGGAVILMLMVFGLRPDLHIIMKSPIFWCKVAFPLLIASGAWVSTMKLSQPIVNTGVSGWPFILPLALLWIVGIWWWQDTPSGEHLTLVYGESWRTCPFNILLLSLPGLAVMLRTMRAQAPAHLRLAGASSGLLAGSVATVIYCFHCPEMSPVFWGIWYVLGMTLPALAGAILGPRLLRW